MLFEGIEVQGASLDNGLLHIDLQRVRPEPQVRTVEIKTGQQSREELSPRRTTRASRDAKRNEEAEIGARKTGRQTPQDPG